MASILILFFLIASRIVFMMNLFRRLIISLLYMPCALWPSISRRLSYFFTVLKILSSRSLSMRRLFWMSPKIKQSAALISISLRSWKIICINLLSISSSPLFLPGILRRLIRVFFGPEFLNRLPNSLGNGFPNIFCWPYT